MIIRRSEPAGRSIDNMTERWSNGDINCFNSYGTGRREPLCVLRSGSPPAVRGSSDRNAAEDYLVSHELHSFISAPRAATRAGECLIQRAEVPHPNNKKVAHGQL